MTGVSGNVSMATEGLNACGPEEDASGFGEASRGDSFRVGFVVLEVGPHCFNTEHHKVQTNRP